MNFSLIVAHVFQAMGSIVAVWRLSCPSACRNLSSWTSDGAHVPCIGRWILHHWTTREVPVLAFFIPQGSVPLVS